MADCFETGTSLVSVLIPLYNKAKWVESTIQSVLNQTHTNLEVVVIDDGSTDNSAEVVSSIDDDRISLRRRENRGANVTRNELLELARGDYVQHLDADDLLRPNKIALQLAGLESGADVSLSRVWMGHVGGRVEPDSPDLGSATAVIHHGIPTFAPLHKLSSLYAVGGWTVGLPASQEYDLHIRLLAHGLWDRPHQIADPLGVVRLVENSTSGHEQRLYSAKAEVLKNAALEAPAALQKEIALALANAARHLARSRDFDGADDALGFAAAIDSSALNEYPRRTRVISSYRMMNRAEWVDSYIKRLADRASFHIPIRA